MTFARVNPIGWAQYELLTSQQMNALDTNVSRSLDGYAGGIYTPSATLELVGVGVPTGPTMKLRAAATGVAIHAVQSTTQAGLMVAGASAISIAGTPALGAIFFGLNNSVGPGGDALYAVGGAGGSGGAGGAAIQAIGGDSSASGTLGGVGGGFRGGVPGDRFGFPQSGAGVYGLGGTPTRSARRGGAGIYGVGGPGASGGFGGAGVIGDGGAPGSSNLGGMGGLFHGYGGTGYTNGGIVGATELTKGAGVVGIAGTSANNSYGVVGLGSSGTTLNASYGGYFRGAEGGYGVVAYPGSNTQIAVAAAGSINFALASSADKNPDVTESHTNSLFAKNVCKAWGVIRDGVLIEGFNIASILVPGSATYAMEVRLAGDMANTNYAVVTGGGWGFTLSTVGRNYYPVIPSYSDSDIDVRLVGEFTLIQVRDSDGAVLDWTESECYFAVYGEQ